MRKLLFIIMITMMMMGCNKQKKDLAIAESDVKSYMEILKTSDIEKVNEAFYAGFTDESVLLENFKKMNYEIIDLEIKEYNENDEKYEMLHARMKISLPDIHIYVPQAREKASETLLPNETPKQRRDAINIEYKKLLTTKDLKYKEKEVTLILDKSKDKWIYNPFNGMNEEFNMFIMGDLTMKVIPKE